MRNIYKTGISVLSIAILSLVGFTAAFGYGGGGGSGGSGWIDPRCYLPVQPPSGGFWGRFHNTPNVFNRSNVQADFDGGDAEFMSVSDTPDFSNAAIEPYSRTRLLNLSSGFGLKNFWVRFFNHCRVPTQAFPFWVNYMSPFGHVLGTQTYADGTLLRGTDKRIYLVKGIDLIYIPDLSTLMKYVGRPILNVEDSIILNFATLNVPESGESGQVLGEQVIGEGTLIRGADKKIYLVKNGKKVWIRSLADLAKQAFGKPILDVADDVIEQY